MDLYSKYLDSKGRTIVVIRRLSLPYRDSSGLRLKPTTVDLLNVEGDEVHQVSYEQMDEWIGNGTLKRIPKT